MNRKYTVARHPDGYGVTVIGPIPASDMAALGKSWQESGFTVIDLALSKALGVTLVVTSEEGGRKWRAALGLGDLTLADGAKKRTIARDG